MLEILTKLGKLACASHNPEDLAQAIICELPKIVNVGRVSLILLDRKELVIPASVGLPKEVQVIRSLVDAPIVKWVSENAKPLIVENIDLDPRFQGRHRREDYDSKSFVSLPLIDQGEVLGVLNLTNHLDGQGFSPEEIRMLELFGNFLAYSLRNSFLLKKIRGNERQLKKANSQLKQRFHETRILYRLWRNMNNVMDLGSLARFILKRMPAILSVRRASIMLRDIRTGKLFVLEGVGLGKEYQKQPYLGSSPVSEWVIANRKPLLINDMSTDPRFAPLRRDGYRTGGFICVPLIHQEEVYGVLNVADKRTSKGFAESDLRLMTIFGNQLGLTLANTQLIEELQRRDQIKEEMTIARQIQAQYLPIALPKVPGMDVAARLSSAEEIGGDFYDFVERDDGRIGVFIGDVSGKGIPAALTMVLSSTHMTELMLSASDPSVFMKCAHRRIMRFSKGIQYVTTAAVFVDAARRKIEFSLAGHQPILHYHAQSGEVRELSEGGLPLGMYDDLDDYPFGSVAIDPADRLLLYTDGVTDARDRFNQAFGKNRLLEVLKANAKETSQTMVDRIQSALIDHTTAVAPFDDFTMICLRVV